MAAAERAEQAGSTGYHDNHMGAIFKEGFSFSGYERDLLVLNRGDGTFLDVSGVSGVDSISDGRGSVFADLDNDGDTDIFLTTAQGDAHFLFRNNVGNRNGFLRVALEGAAAGKDAFGAVVRVRGPEGLRVKLKSGGSGFLSQHDPRLTFGLGDDPAPREVEVVWPGGEVQRVGPVAPGSAIRVVQGRRDPLQVAERRFSLVDPLSPEDAVLARLGFRTGQPLPDLALRSPDGSPSRLADLLRPGRRLLVNFWATWCVPCAKEMPELERLAPALKRAGVDLVGISVDLDTADQVPGYLRERNITYPVYTTDEAALERLYPTGEATVPVTVLIDGSGSVTEIHSGWSARSERALRALTASRRGG